MRDKQVAERRTASAQNALKLLNTNAVAEAVMTPPRRMPKEQVMHM